MTIKTIINRSNDAKARAMFESYQIMLEQDEIINHLEQAGFSNITTKKFFVTNKLTDWFLNAGKYRPEIYLDPVVRAGISTFARLLDDPEGQAGLRALKSDIEDKTIQSIINKYENQDGGYLFVCAVKILRYFSCLI